MGNDDGKHKDPKEGNGHEGRKPGPMKDPSKDTGKHGKPGK